MAVLKLQKYGSPLLREKAMPVNKVDDEIRELVNDMIETMYAEGGVGLAAPQVGISKRIIVIDNEEKEVLVLINPVIVKREGEVKEEEGCLSIPGVYSPVRRSSLITVEALDLNEKKIQITKEGFLAIVLQHEIDHLDGYLFIDRISPAKRLMLKEQLKSIE
ncbi:MAG: peptide deformylase [Atribacterota bacterium]|jgi:peptide deformylase|nr:peptide deformylase [Candidatus Atribacteria bacterium]MDD3539204.1 peptide deformylase [Atribacterota bacterium]MDD5497208.1 peptide deformylase [Atribacterota bacterium]